MPSPLSVFGLKLLEVHEVSIESLGRRIEAHSVELSSVVRQLVELQGSFATSAGEQADSVTRHSETLGRRIDSVYSAVSKQVNEYHGHMTNATDKIRGDLIAVQDACASNGRRAFGCCVWR